MVHNQVAVLNQAPEDCSPQAARISAADIRRILQTEIENGTLLPGTPLEERSLAARFGVSRTKIRQALHLLASHDLVEIEPYFGVRVKQLSLAELRDILEYCGQLETAVARLAARRLDAASRARIEAAVQRCRDAAAGQGDYQAANREFHEALCDCAKSPYLVRQLVQTRGLFLRYVQTFLDTPAQIQRSLQEHVEIAEAVFASDEERAARLMDKHIPNGGHGIAEILARVPAQLAAPRR